MLLTVGMRPNENRTKKLVRSSLTKSSERELSDVVSFFANAVKVDPDIVLIASAVPPIAFSLSDSRLKRMNGLCVMCISTNQIIIPVYLFLNNFLKRGKGRFLPYKRTYVSMSSAPMRKMKTDQYTHTRRMRTDAAAPYASPICARER